jgi:hypothetical protein
MVNILVYLLDYKEVHHCCLHVNKKQSAVKVMDVLTSISLKTCRA